MNVTKREVVDNRVQKPYVVEYSLRSMLMHKLCAEIVFDDLKIDTSSNERNLYSNSMQPMGLTQMHVIK